MNYSKIRRRNRRRILVAWIALLLIGMSIGTIILSGFIHLFYCEDIIRVSAEEPKVKVIEQPKAEVAEEPKIISLGEYKLTAYCACFECCQKNPGDVGYGITKSGVRAVQGVTVAADPRFIPLGTKICIDGHEYIVQDTGGAIKGNRIDVYFDHHQAALEFGVQYKEIYMVKEGEKI